MIQAQRIARMAEAAGISHQQAETALAALYGTIATDLCDGERARLPGIGTLVAIPVAEHPGHNPKTGEPITIPARRKIKFSASEALKKGLAEFAAGLQPTGVSRGAARAAE